jgi:hypothetical protein
MAVWATAGAAYGLAAGDVFDLSTAQPNNLLWPSYKLPRARVVLDGSMPSAALATTSLLVLRCWESSPGWFTPLMALGLVLLGNAVARMLLLHTEAWGWTATMFAGCLICLRFERGFAPRCCYAVGLSTRSCQRFFLSSAETAAGTNF